MQLRNYCCPIPTHRTHVVLDDADHVAVRRSELFGNGHSSSNIRGRDGFVLAQIGTHCYFDFFYTWCHAVGLEALLEYKLHRLGAGDAVKNAGRRSLAELTPSTYYC